MHPPERSLRGSLALDLGGRRSPNPGYSQAPRAPSQVSRLLPEATGPRRLASRATHAHRTFNCFRLHMTGQQLTMTSLVCRRAPPQNCSTSHPNAGRPLRTSEIVTAGAEESHLSKSTKRRRGLQAAHQDKLRVHDVRSGFCCTWPCTHSPPQFRSFRCTPRILRSPSRPERKAPKSQDLLQQLKGCCVLLEGVPRKLSYE